MHKPLLPEGIAQPEDIADAVAWLASDGIEIRYRSAGFGRSRRCTLLIAPRY